MKIALPSRGLLGCSEVELQTPTYRHLRDITQVEYPLEQVGYEFVKSLLVDPSALARMTFQDKDYLLTVAVAAMHLNAIPFRVTCQCGKPVNAVYTYGEQELYYLPEDTEVVTEKEIDGKVYQFHILSADAEYRLAQWAEEQADGDDKALKRKYEEGFVCLTFGYDLTDEGLKAVADFPLLVYYSALLFREMTFHGCPPSLTVTCKECGQQINVFVPFAQSLLSWSSADIVNEFMAISKYTSGFDGFLSLTFAEAAQIARNVEEMNERQAQ